MDLRLKIALLDAIGAVLDAAAEDSTKGSWDGYIHGGLVRQMTDAAELVFDASEAAQAFAAKQED